MSHSSIDERMRHCVEQYFTDLQGTEPEGLFELFMAAAERPLLDVVMQHAEGNQTKAAQWLGINRNTLHRKLVEHRLAA